LAPVCRAHSTQSNRRHAHQLSSPPPPTKYPRAPRDEALEDGLLYCGMLLQEVHQSFELWSREVALCKVALPITVDQIVRRARAALTPGLNMVNADVWVGNLQTAIGAVWRICHDDLCLGHGQRAGLVGSLAPCALQGLGFGCLIQGPARPSWFSILPTTSHRERCMK